jgi:hypothetical protein
MVSCRQQSRNKYIMKHKTVKTLYLHVNITYKRVYTEYIQVDNIQKMYIACMYMYIQCFTYTFGLNS